MKKYILIILSLLLITGCSEKDIMKETKKVNDNYKKQENLIKDNKKASNEEELVNYIDNIEKEVDDLTTSKKSIRTENKLKNTFITLTDFVFYGGTIKGMTFNELSDSAKTKVLNTIDSIDTKINNKYPNYKESIKDKSKRTYSNAKEKIKETKQTILDKYKEKVGTESFNETMDAYNSDKENLKEAYSPYKPAVDTAKEKAKETYKKAKEKVSKWYNNYKEEN